MGSLPTLDWQSLWLALHHLASLVAVSGGGWCHFSLCLCQGLFRFPAPRETEAGRVLQSILRPALLSWWLMSTVGFPLESPPSWAESSAQPSLEPCRLKLFGWWDFSMDVAAFCTCVFREEAELHQCPGPARSSDPFWQTTPTCQSSATIKHLAPRSAIFILENVLHSENTLAEYRN